ncbi:secreted protein [Colletotrichum scovillei]|uniref:uncharacterized protein n=1 Tax=Colletotrichum scovillei TaxID=1209932 RepID=UPI0015C39452|nr:uncharacterized protein HER10_EVM0009747 [Colletotrichum scovillei]KAF4780148.1 secreted protein [Colletotrichum scovillei]
MHPCEEFGQQNLSFVLAVEETSVSNASSTAINLGRVIDITTLVDPATRSISWMSPKDSQSTWRLMACAAGAKKLTGFFDEYMIPEEQDRELLVRVGKYAWEDSMETVTALWWTHNFADAFRAQRGYDITPCLPFLIQLDNYWAAQNLPYGESFLSQDNSTLVSRCNDDYRLTLQAGYEDYILTTSEWAHKRGLKYSNQPSLGFDESPSLYRHLSGPAHMARNPVVSSEAGAVNGAGYTQTIADLLRIVRRGLAGGISMNVLHGYAYSGTYAQTTWPGYTVFAYTFTDMWGPRMPAWRGSSQHVGGKGDNDTSDGFMADAMAYVARNQFISQVGTARVDLAFYQYAAPFDKVVYESDNLEKMGFTYDYLGPASFSSQHAAVNEKGILAPDGPAYKALIFANQTKLTLEMAMQTRTFAEAGLPIFVIGSADFQSVGVDGAASMESVMVLKSAEEVPAALAALNIQPRVLFLEGGEVEKWYSFSRSTDDAEVVFLYNDGETSTTTNVSILDMEGRSPHVLDAWTGSASPLLQYTVEENNVVLPEATTLDVWNITVNDWRGSNNSLCMETAVTPYRFPNSPLAPWKDLDPVNLSNTSGTATYETTFRTPSSSTAAQRLGAHLHLGAIIDAMTLWVNDERIILDVNSSPDVVVDITSYLNPSEGADNVVLVEVASTLYNRVRPEQDSIMTSGGAASRAGASYFEAHPAEEYVLKGPVSVQWVKVVDIL